MVLLLIPSEKATASRQASDSSLEIGKRYELALPEEQGLALRSLNNKGLRSTKNTDILQVK
ncbi:MAG: peptidase M23, partial [Colwellia sp.]